MRHFARLLLAASPIAWSGTSPAQQEAAPSPDEFVCALTGECGEEAEAGEAPASAPGGARVSATRGVGLSGTRPAGPARVRGTGPGRHQIGRVDLRLGFAPGSAVMSAADRARVEALAEALNRPQLATVRVRIEGHTDSSGDRAVNLDLSQRRARAVADFLIARGIAAGRLEVRGYGFDRPLPGMPASAGENRRVEAVRIS